MKKSFVLYLDQYEPIKDLSDEQKGQLLDAMFKYHNDVDFELTNPVLKMAFSFFKETFKRDYDKYLKRCEKNRENVRKRWDTKDTNVYDGIRPDTNHTDSDSDTIVIEDNGSDIKDNDNLLSAKKIITRLNTLCNKKFRFGANNTKNIVARLKEGFTEEDCIKVLEIKIQDPYFIKNPQHYNPETLFRPSKFEKYLNENPSEYKKDGSIKKTGFTKDYYKPSSTGDKNEFF